MSRNMDNKNIFNKWFDLENSDEYDFQEDFAFENGTYINRCHTCNISFMGHKRRITCKKCETEYKQKNKNDTVEISKIYIHCPGDYQAGISSSNWTIDGDFCFDDLEELERFKENLRVAWVEYLCDTRIIIYSKEEWDKKGENDG